MDKNGPIIIIEDDADDREFLVEAFRELEYKNEVVFFENGNDALNYLLKPEVTPFLILSDINMPKLDGFKLRNQVFSNKDLNAKCVPYLFFTSASDERSVQAAYSLSVQGFFTKPKTSIELRDTIKTIIHYWTVCISPNEFNRRRQ